MEKNSYGTARPRVMFAISCLLIAAAAGLFVRSFNHPPWSGEAFVNSFLLVQCAWSFVEWWLVRKDPKPTYAKWTRSRIYLIVMGICVCFFFNFLMRSWPMFSSAVIAGALAGLGCITLLAHGTYLERKGLRSEHAGS